MAFGYIFGLFQSGYFLGKTKGIDIRTKGSGNIGTTNSFRVFGKYFGIATLLLDVLKTVLAVYLGRYILYNILDYNPDTRMLYSMYIGFGVILGHDFPFFLKFKGGKGVASGLGLLLSLGDYRIAAAAVIVFLILFLSTGYVSLGSIFAYISYALMTVIFGSLGFYTAPPFNLDAKYMLELYALAIVITILAVYKHESNIKRLLAGNENRFNVFGKGRK